MNGVWGLIGSVLALLGVIYTVWTSRRGQVFSEAAATRQELRKLERRIRAAIEYIDICMADYRRRGIDPPPVPNRVPAPWEEP